MSSDDCSIFKKDQRTVYQDMNHPLCDYFISSSHNTYLVSDQLLGPSDLWGYTRYLDTGFWFLIFETCLFFYFLTKSYVILLGNKAQIHGENVSMVFYFVCTLFNIFAKPSVHSLEAIYFFFFFTCISNSLPHSKWNLYHAAWYMIKSVFNLMPCKNKLLPETNAKFLGKL